MIDAGSQSLDKFKAFAKTLSQTERENYKVILSLACRKALSKNQADLLQEDRELFKTTSLLLSSLQPHSRRISEDGIAWHGRPLFLTDDILEELREESASLRQNAVRIGDQMVVTAGPVAKRFGQSKDLFDFLKKHAGHIQSTKKSNYMYYDKVGMGTDPHIDNHEYPLNVILILNHQFMNEASSFLMFPVNQDLKRVTVKPGEIIAFYADSVVHARERMKVGEFLAMAAFGFRFIENEEVGL